MPRVSVIIPVHNRAHLIRGAIDSVLAQDFADFELIVVDDASTDGTAAAAQGYQDARIRVLELPKNGGSNAARNVGIRAATAPLIAFLDSDDAYLPIKLSSVVREFDARPELDVLVDSFVKNCSPTAKRRRVERHNPRIDCTDEFARKLFARQLWKATPAITVKRDAAVRAGLFDEGVSRRQDMDFLIRLTEFANCAATDQVLWVKSWSPDSISAGNQFVPSTLELVRRHPQYLRSADCRRGLATDFARHLLRLVRTRRFRQAGQDVGRIVRELGPVRSTALLLRGTRELTKRFVDRRIKRRRGSPAPRPASRSAAARNRASARS